MPTCIFLASFAWVLLVSPAPAGAQAAAPGYPEKPIRMIVGFSAGGGSDFAARIVAPKLTEALGQTFVIDNRTGANDAIAAELAARAPADGYTLMMLAVAQAIGAAHGTKLPYDVLRDGSEAVGSTPLEFARLLRSEMARFARVIRDAGIRAE